MAAKVVVLQAVGLVAGEAGKDQVLDGVRAAVAVRNDVGNVGVVVGCFAAKPGPLLAIVALDPATVAFAEG